MDRETHKRYLDYRERHDYFGATSPILNKEQFLAMDAEQLTLEAKGEDGRDDEEEARFAELCKALFRD